jgi:outer membrane protein
MRHALSLSLALAVLSSSLSAETLSWKQVLAEASRNSPVIKSANASVQSNESLIRANQSANLPALSATFTADYGTNNNQIPEDPGDSYLATLSLSQNIFNGWETTARVEQARVNTTIAETNLLISKAQLSNDLKTAYANLIYAQRAIRLQESIRDRRKANLDLVELRFQNGAENKGSVLLSKAYLQEADLRLMQARNSIDESRAQLARAIGRDRVSDLQVEENLPMEPVSPKPDLQKLAMETPQRKQAIQKEKLADADITLAKAGYFPNLSLDGSYGKRDRFFFPENESWSVGVSLTIPIFNGGRDYYSTQSKIASRTVAGANREDIDRQLLVTLQTALARLQEAKRSVDVNRAFLSAAEMRSEIGRGRYNNGLLSFEDWDLIESDLISRQQSSIQSQRDYSIAEAAWENAIGKGSIP